MQNDLWWQFFEQKHESQIWATKGDWNATTHVVLMLWCCAWCDAWLTDVTMPCDLRCSIPMRTSSWAMELNHDTIWRNDSTSAPIQNHISPANSRSGQTTFSLWLLDLGGWELGSLKKNGPVLGVISGDTIQGPPVIGGRMEGREHGGARDSARLASKTKSKIRKSHPVAFSRTPQPM